MLLNSTTVCRTSLILGSKCQASGAQGRHLELLVHPIYMSNGCRYKVQIMCTDAIGRLLHADRKYAGMRRVSHNVIPCKKNSAATYIMRYQNSIPVTFRIGVGL